MEPSLFERLGGEPVLRAVIDEFVDRVFADVMIGFHFRGADPARIKRFEYQFAAGFLGAPGAYEGRPLDVAHAPHPITGGQFHRRLQILREVLAAHGVAPEVVEAWMEHSEEQRPLITRDPGSRCLHGSPP